MTSTTGKRILLASALTLALAGPARADKQACDGAACLAVLPATAAYAWLLNLKPTPPLIHALRELEARDHTRLKQLLERHPQLVRLTPEQSALLATMEADTAHRSVEWTYVLHPSQADSAGRRFIEHKIDERDWRALELELKISPDAAAAVDGGYVLLREAVRAGDLDAVGILLDAGVRADAHRNGALAVAREDGVRQLLLARGATPR